VDSYNSMNPTQLRVHSGVGTNLKVGGHQSGAKGRKIFFGRAPQLLLALKVQLVVLVSAFVMVSTIWSVFCLLFFYSRCPACPAICKSGGGDTCPPVTHGVSATACTEHRKLLSFCCLLRHSARNRRGLILQLRINMPNRHSVSTAKVDFYSAIP